MPGHRRRLFVLAAATCAGFALLLACLSGAWLIRNWQGDDWGNRVPPDVLADYVPEDSVAVLAVNVRQLLATPSGRQYLKPWLQQLSEQAESELRWIDLAGIKPIGDIDTLFVSFPSGSGAEPLWLARGRFDRSRFRIGPDKLQEKLLDRYRIWEYSDRPMKRTTLLAVAGDTLVISETRNRIQAALKQVGDPQPIHVRDAALCKLLNQVDRRQTLWLAASMRRLGPISGIDNYLLKMVLRPLLARAESVYGGITCDEDLRAELHFGAATDEDAIHLETDLKSLCEAAPGAVLLSRHKEILPLLQLLGAGQIHRDGKTIMLRCRLPAGQLER